jgi:molybdopterin molybdotransferase
MTSFARKIVTLDEAWSAVDEAFDPVGPGAPGDAGKGDSPAARPSPREADMLPPAEAVGRVLLAEQRSLLDLPPFDKSAMDGYAICAGDRRREYRLLASVAAGRNPTEPLVPGSAVKVMTGAPVPQGAALVVKREHAEELGPIVRVFDHGGEPNICRRGEDVREGDVIFPAGRVLTAADTANLVSCGIVEVPVAARVRLAIISTGDEIVDDPAGIVPGKIMNSNGPMLAALAARWGMDAVRVLHVPDDLPATVSALRESLAAADIVAVSGGVSVGDFDYVLAAMDEAHLAVRFSSVAIKPGRPTVLATPRPGPGAPGRRGNRARAVFGLPGNPLSVFVMFHVFVLRAAARLQGSRWPLRQIRMPLGRPISRRKADRLEFFPAAIGDDGRVSPVECHGSAHLLALRDADGLLQVPAGVRKLSAGDGVLFTPLRSLMP